MKSAREAQMPILAPLSWARATRALEEARRYRENGARREDWIRSLEVGLAAVREGRRHAEVARRRLDDALDARHDARKAGANEFVSSYPDAEAALLRLSTALEKGDDAYVDRHLEEVAEQFRGTETLGVTNRFLGGSEMVVAEAVKEGASDYAPETLAATRGKLASIREWIAKHPRSIDTIRDKADEAYSAANRLLRVTRDGHAFATRSPEENVLWVEQHLSSLREAIDAEEPGDKGLAAQFAELRDDVGEVEEERARLAKEMKDQGDEEGSDVAESEAPPAVPTPREKLVDDKLAEAKKLFTPAEADVYRNGQRIWLRLHGLRFTSGRHGLTPEDRALLGKVKSAIALFPNPRVMILGRTDTSGPLALNQRIALSRARAVRQFLVGSRAAPEDRLVAQGVSSDAPGPGKNGGNGVIDVLIEPEHAVAE